MVVYIVNIQFTFFYDVYIVILGSCSLILELPSSISHLQTSYSFRLHLICSSPIVNPKSEDNIVFKPFSFVVNERIPNYTKKRKNAPKNNWATKQIII